MLRKFILSREVTCRVKKCSGRLSCTLADNARGPGLQMSRSRPNLAGSDAQILAGSSPVTTPVQERPDVSFRDSASRRDMGNADRSRREHHHRSSEVGGRGRDRASRRSSRERGNVDTPDKDRDRDRDRERERERDGKDVRDMDYRDRERRQSGVPGGGGGGARDERDSSSRRSMCESTGDGSGVNRELLPAGGGGRDLPGPPRESSSHRSSHRGGGEGRSGRRGGTL